MTSEFTLPDVGEGLESAEIIEWLVSEGEVVQRDQPLVEILTDKSQTQLPSPVSGTVTRLRFGVGDIAEVGQVLVEFDGGRATTAGSDEPRPEPASPGPAGKPAVTPTRPKAAPVVRRRALEAGVDLATVTGTGPGGRITNADLDHVLTKRTPSDEPAMSPAPPGPKPPHQPPGGLGWMEPGVHPLRGIRRVTAEAMTRSWRIPHINATDEADATELLAARARIRQRDPVAAADLTPLAFFVMAVAASLRKFPLMNASIDTDSGTITVHEPVNIGIAVASAEGLSVPVIGDADRRHLFDLAAEIRRLSDAVRDRSVATAELRGGTATISNYGSLGGRFASPIIRSPEVVIVGFGAIRPRPFVVDGEIAARPTLPVAIAADHRLIDGDLLTAFQGDVISRLTDPVSLLAR